MATEVIRTTFQLKRGLASAWERVNPILAPGEPGWTLDTHILKIGDGVTPWNELQSLSSVEITETDLQKIIEEYLEENPVQVTTDAGLSTPGLPADAAAVRANCVFNTDTLILKAGGANENSI